MSHQNSELATILVIATVAMIAWSYLLFELSTHLQYPALV